jgi:apolipoprotein N-acyltransferase
VVHPSGNIQHQTQLNKAETIHATVFPRDEITFYARFGDVFAWINILGLCLIFGRGYIQKDV